MSQSLNPSALARLLGEWNLGAAPAYRELADVVRLLVLDGRVALNTALPSERGLSEALGVSRTTLRAALIRLHKGAGREVRVREWNIAGSQRFCGEANKVRLWEELLGTHRRTPFI